MIDCGADWLGRIRAIAPTAIVLTHAHADHAAGLAGGCSIPGLRHYGDIGPAASLPTPFGIGTRCRCERS
jgi:glyoxylase-like metal-dependent hydrolase (beta-lactamase superfamily II)